MTKREVVELMTVLQANYPDSFKGQSDAVVGAKVALWHDIFKHYPREIVHAAAVAFMATDTKGFMPNVGQIVDHIHRMDRKNDRTPDEAWRLVYKAIQNSTWGAAEEFEKLPEDIRRFVGHPNQLREWALMDASTVQSVIASNFQRSFKVRQDNDRDFAKLPPEIKQYAARLSSDVFGYLEDGGDQYEETM